MDEEPPRALDRPPGPAYAAGQRAAPAVGRPGRGIMRGRWVGGLAVVLGLVASLGSVAPPPLAAAPAPAAPSLQSAVVQMATVESGGNAGFYIAMERGYFQEQGIQLDLTKFATGIDYVPALASCLVVVAYTDLR